MVEVAGEDVDDDGLYGGGSDADGVVEGVRGLRFLEGVHVEGVR